MCPELNNYTQIISRDCWENGCSVWYKLKIPQEYRKDTYCEPE